MRYFFVIFLSLFLSCTCDIEPDGSVVLKDLDGKKSRVIEPDGTELRINKDGSKSAIKPDGTMIITDSEGVETVIPPEEFSAHFRKTIEERTGAPLKWWEVWLAKFVEFHLKTKRDMNLEEATDSAKADESKTDNPAKK